MLLSVWDSGVFWVANVGDSRGVMAVGSSDPTSNVKVLSYDHKPSQV